MSVKDLLESKASGSKMEELMRQEEDSAIADNLAHIDKFLDTLEGRGTDGLSQDQINRIDQLKSKFVKVVTPLSPKKSTKKLFKPNSDSDIKPKGNKKSDRAAANELMSLSDDSSDSTADGHSTSYSTANTTNEGSSSDQSKRQSKTKSKKNVKKIKTKKVKKEKKHSEESEETEEEEQLRNRKESDIQLLVRAFSRLDGRKVPAQEKFDEKSGQDLKRYLKKFESYCESNYKGDRSLWIGELERHLSGKVLEALRAVRDVDDSYERVKDKLLEWYNNMKDLRKKKNRSRYEQAQFIPGESLYLYSSRLEKLYRVAHPNHNVKTSKSIQEKLQASIPKSARILLSSQIMSYKLNNKKVTWKVIQQCARYYDLEREKEHGEERKKGHESEEEVTISVGQGKKYKDVATQDEQPISNLPKGRVNLTGQTQNKGHMGTKPAPHSQRVNPFASPYQNLQGATGIGMYSPAFSQYMPGYSAPLSAPFYTAGSQTSQGYNPNHVSFGGPQRAPVSSVSQPIFDRPPSHLANRTVRCTFCNRLGHAITNCRTKWNCCYWCGSAGHYFRQCPQHSINKPNNLDYRNNDSGYHFSNNNRDQNNNRSQSQTRFPQQLATRGRGGHQPVGQHHDSRRRYNSGPGNLNGNSLI